MKAFDELLEQDLRWVQPSAWKSNYELVNEDGEVLASLTRPSWWRTLVEAEAVGNRWTFERKGFWRYRIEIKSVGTQAEPALFDYKGMGGGGELKFNDGRVFLWRQGNFWGTKWGWMTPDEEPIMGFKVGGMFKLNSEISFDPGALDMPSLPLLIMLGWYLYTLYQQDAAGASASSVAVMS